MFSREYVPMCSGNGFRYPISNTVDDDIMISMLVPPQHMANLVWKDGSLDFGMTLVKIIAALAVDEYVVALGAYDCSLELEAYLAAKESTASRAI